MERFTDRQDAGRRLAQKLSERAWTDPLVLALPRGGVPVAAAVARALGAELDVLVVRKLGVPGHEEVAMGAVGEDGAAVLNDDVIGMGSISASDVAAGATARAGCAIARARGAAQVVLAVPVAPPDAAAHVPEADEVICVLTPESLMSVGMHYIDFAQVTDEEVVEQLREFRS